MAGALADTDFGLANEPPPQIDRIAPRRVLLINPTITSHHLRASHSRS